MTTQDVVIFCYLHFCGLMGGQEAIVYTNNEVNTSEILVGRAKVTSFALPTKSLLICTSSESPHNLYLGMDEFLVVEFYAVHVYMYILITYSTNIHTDRQTYRLTNRHTEGEYLHSITMRYWINKRIKIKSW